MDMKDLVETMFKKIGKGSDARLASSYAKVLREIAEDYPELADRIEEGLAKMALDDDSNGE